MDPSFWLARLRAEFPDTGVLFDGTRWIAVRGRTWITVTGNAIELYDRLMAGGVPHRGRT